AAVVSGFAGGMGSATKETPQAVIDVALKYEPADPSMMIAAHWNMEFTLLSGNSIPTKDLAIITYYTNSTGGVTKHEQTAASNSTELYPTYPGNLARVPFLSDMRYGYAGNNPLVDFGNFTWKVRDIMCTNGDPGTAELLGIDDGAGGFLSEADFGSGKVVEVKILHIPSGKYIYDKEVVVS
ncbi:MAG: type IV pilin N-terminal domain-containing protein, partial [Methanoregula sp.]